MNAAKTGFIGEFENGYLQREIRLRADVIGGIDKGLRDAADVGFAVGRFVQITKDTTDPTLYHVAAPTTAVSATGIGSATHIIAQSDDTIRDVPEDYNYTERYTTLPNLIVKNTGTGTSARGEAKTIAVYKIVNPDDITIINLGT